jgi:outer membrane protein OmpA-like peptidoglycan-associated protein
LLLVPALAIAAAAADHPMISRFPGAEIRSSSVKAFDQLALPLGPFKRKQITPSQWSGAVEKTQTLEGKVTRIVYTNPEGRSSLEIFRSYRDALAKAGFEILFECGGAECAEPGTNDDVPDFGRWCHEGLDCKEAMRYVAAHLTRPEGDVYVGVKVLINGYSTGGTTLGVVEVKPLQADLVTVKSADAIKTDIGATGHSPIYGVYFDTGKAIVKPESDPTLAEIAKLLEANPAMKIHVVGHTDNVGTLPLNMTLSKQRADAVVAALVGRWHVAAARLDAAGVGSLAPVTTNRTEEGRAKNRRVELVEM